MRAFSLIAHDRIDSKLGAWSSTMSSCSSTLQSAKSSSNLCPPAVDDGDDKVLMTVDVCLKETSSAPYPEVKARVAELLASQQLRFGNAQLNFLSASHDGYLDQHVKSINLVCERANHPAIQEGTKLLFWQVEFAIYVFQLCAEGPADSEDSEDGISAYREFELPAREFHGLWESLIYDEAVKQRLVTYAATALYFSDRQVDQQLIAFNRTVLLHGPAGTGKTSLCKALAQHLSVRFQYRYRHAQLIEVNAHSLFSKYFSESGKLVGRLFARIQEQVEEKDTLVFVLIDEVESLTSARQSAVAGNEPADAIRAVNALLTQLDALKAHTNVMVLTTSNITEAIDLAFLDRADIKAFIGPPSWQARYEILRSCITELQAKSVLEGHFKALPPFAEAMATCVLQV
ncbi:hypothetical protein WJX73_000394 [Symbiochloris irregularis]|uniref:Pachytene checkpoint protein 2 homolog n=1 Tax=Symbiochloris irregularis TaxID=706552 RepID=A0AAW1PQL7_9CHLO